MQTPKLVLFIGLYSRPVLKILPSASVWPGEAVILQCLVQTKQPQVHLKYRFFKDSKELRYTGSVESMKIVAAEPATAGRYHCEIEDENEGMTRASVPVMLNVESGNLKPKLIMKDRNSIPLPWEHFKIAEGESFTLKCQIPGDSTGWKYTWHKNIDEDLPADGCQEPGFTYLVSFAKPLHLGMYWCRGQRGDFYSDFSEPVIVNVTGKI
ncbi:basement membrane-specific heparan sulfate proteoglycan core protein-like isoform X2 [Polypterus senegalus]|uniref:basement membrane-specific heparan sulfate proteoglycan core protein-like isoform X2 n=1 Tax=Polypterus senegalus TaxID=55291 RepID=UPI001963DA83|nr:basement membrane-specific heparan sulfate proteoglycan core protein-like isoform X2 [Polypterus senegalus]